LFWNPSRATCINGNRNERFYEINSKFKDKLQTKLADFKRSDIVTMDTVSLQELSLAEETSKI